MLLSHLLGAPLAWLPEWPTEEADIEDCGWYGVGRCCCKIWNVTDFPT